MGIRDWFARPKRAVKRPLTDEEIADLKSRYDHGLHLIREAPMDPESRESARGHLDQRVREWVKNYLESLI